MKIFVTGGTGYIGRRVVTELVEAGHEVVGLARSPERGETLAELGAAAAIGELSTPHRYRGAAARVDVIVHMGFDYSSPVENDRLAIQAFLEATEGREATVVYTSGLWVVGNTGGATLGDDAPVDEPAEIVEWRVPHERRVLEAAGDGRVTAVVRPGFVYGRGGGLTARMFATAAKTGAAEYVGDGTNYWSNIHVDDLARLYLAIVESGKSGIYNAVDGTPETVASIAAAASRAAGGDGSTRGVSVDEVRQKLGAVADAMCLDQRLVAPAALALGWRPERTSFTGSAPAAFEEWLDTRED